MLKEKTNRKLNGSDLAQHLYEKAFGVPRDPRSDAYRRGVRAALDYRFSRIRINGNVPYKPGTAEYDAFFSGTEEGHRIWRNYMDSLKKDFRF